MIASKRDSLCMRILRAKYKVKDDWLRAEASRYASPTWKAIKKAREVVRRGACFLIGDGESIDVWLDPWVPWIKCFIPSLKVESSSLLPMKVAELIDFGTHTWKTTMVRDIFNPTSTQAILSIPIPIRLRPDKLVWVPKSKGLFSVKSAYKELLPNPPSQVVTEVNWSKLWKMSRIDISEPWCLLWRVTVNALPKRENLMSRIDISEPWCLLCNQEVESASHLFLKCPAAKARWGFKSDEVHLAQPSDIIKVILEPPQTLCQVQDMWLVSLNMALTLEEIWCIHNAIIYLEGNIDLQESIRRIGTKLNECAKVFPFPQAPLAEQPVVHWSPPPLGYIKLNVDAAISQNNSALTIIARDAHGFVLKAWSKILPKRSPLSVETEAILWALQLAKSEAWSKIIMESDSKNSIDAIMDCMSCPPWSISSLISDIGFLAKSFGSCLFFWISRIGNSAAHEVARYALVSLVSFCSVSDNLPASVACACKEDASFC